MTPSHAKGVGAGVGTGEGLKRGPETVDALGMERCRRMSTCVRAGELRARVRRVVAALVCLGAASGVWAQEGKAGAGKEESRPASARRFVRLFTFDDPGNPDPVPMGWLRAQEDPTLVPTGKLDATGAPTMRVRSARAGFPPYNRAAYDFTTAASGKASIRVPVNGGSAALRLQPGELPIFSDADYAVTAKVKTRGLVNARAFLTARMLDARLKPIEGSAVRSSPVGDDGSGRWRSVTVELPGKFPEAAWLQIDLEVLQAKLWRAPGAAADHEVWEEDLNGTAWFDDVLVYLQPRSVLRSLSVCNVAEGDERSAAERAAASSGLEGPAGAERPGPVLQASVRDLGGDPLQGRMTVTDLRGKAVATTLFPLDPSGLAAAWVPRLPGFGYYTARLDVLARADDVDDAVSGGGAAVGGAMNVASSSLPLAWMPSAPALGAMAPGSAKQYMDDLRRFGVSCDGADASRLGVVADAIERMGTRFVLLPIFDPGVERGEVTAHMQAQSAALDRMLSRGQTLTFVLERAPAALIKSAILDPGDPMAMLTRPSAEWFGYMQPILDRYGQQVRRYQVGAPGMESNFWRSSLSADVAGFEERLSTLVPGPRISLAWRADQERPLLRRPEPVEVIEAGAAGAGRAGEEDLAAARRRAAARRPNWPLLSAVTLFVPSSIGSDQIPGVIRSWLAPDAQGEVPELTLVFELPERGKFTDYDRVRELGKRVIRAWSTLPAPRAADKERERDDAVAGDVRLAVMSPWDRADERAGSVTPRPEWPVFTTLARELAGRRVVGTYPTDPDVVCLILAHEEAASLGDAESSGDMTRGMLVAWRDQPPALGSVVEIRGKGGAGARSPTEQVTRPALLNVSALGEQVQVVDLFGNRRALTAAERANGIELTDTPVFIDGIDPYVAKFVSGMKLEPRFVESSGGEHESHVVLTNPWPIRVTGSLQIRETEEGDASGKGARTARRGAWNISPAGIVEFAIGPGETFRLPVTFSFGSAQLEGLKQLEILARVTADKEYPLLKQATTLEIGLADFQMDLKAQRLPTTTGPDMVVVASITNTSDRARSLRLEATTSSHPTQQLLISDLGPGQTIVKRFSYKGSGREMAGKLVVVSLSDLEEAKRLNKAVVAP